MVKWLREIPIAKSYISPLTGGGDVICDMCHGEKKKKERIYVRSTYALRYKICFLLYTCVVVLPCI